MAVRRPGFVVFGMSFLDVIGSAFGAVLLVFIIVSVMSAARSAERSQVTLRTTVTAFKGTVAEPDEPIPLRVQLVVPLDPDASPRDLEALMKCGTVYDLRQLVRATREPPSGIGAPPTPAAPGAASPSANDLTRIGGAPEPERAVDARAAAIASELLLSTSESPGILVSLRGPRPKRFWLLLTAARQLPGGVTRVRVDTCVLSGDIVDAPDDRVTKDNKDQPINLPLNHIDRRLSRDVDAEGFIEREKFISATIVVPVRMKDR